MAVSYDCFFYSTEYYFIFILEKESEREKQKMSHHSRLRENEDLPL